MVSYPTSNVFGVQLLQHSIERPVVCQSIASHKELLLDIVKAHILRISSSNHKLASGRDANRVEVLILGRVFSISPVVLQPASFDVASTLQHSFD